MLIINVNAKFVPKEAEKTGENEKTEEAEKTGVGNTEEAEIAGETDNLKHSSSAFASASAFDIPSTA